MKLSNFAFIFLHVTIPTTTTCLKVDDFVILPILFLEDNIHKPNEVYIIFDGDF